MNRIKTYDSIPEFERENWVEPLHSLINITDFSRTKPVNMEGACRFNYYSIFLKEGQSENVKYGSRHHDCQTGTLVFIAPMQVINMWECKPDAPEKGWALLFHPCILYGTQLERNMKKYTFFSCMENWALHLSKHERDTVLECFRGIENELRYGMDDNSRDIIVSRLELFLNYCKRFYERKFIPCLHVENDILARFEQLLDGYFYSRQPKEQGFPTVKYFAGRMNISADYLSRMLRKDTCKSAQEHIHQRLIETAKERLVDKNMSVSEIAYDLGFEYPQYFCRLFKRYVGVTPNEYRKMEVQR